VYGIPGLRGGKKALEELKRNTRKDLDALSEKVLAKYESGINTFLKRFGVEFQIAETAASFVGGKPSTSYKLSIDNVAISLGDSKTADSVASFRNTLSDGDKNSLAFAFFVACLSEDPNLSTKIIVCDDPISSLDRQRKTQTAQELLRLAQTAEQMIVLSHDPGFLRLMWEKFDHTQTKTLEIGREGSALLNRSISALTLR
jgi:wobble nucleotide-excising tRNase